MRLPSIAVLCLSVVFGLAACKPSEKPEPQGKRTSARAPSSKAKPSAAKPAVAPDAPPATENQEPELRFDMTQDGKQMSADQFDSWLDERGVKVASGAAAGDKASSAAKEDAALAREPATSRN